MVSKGVFDRYRGYVKGGGTIFLLLAGASCTSGPVQYCLKENTYKVAESGELKARYFENCEANDFPARRISKRVEGVRKFLDSNRADSAVGKLNLASSLPEPSADLLELMSLTFVAFQQSSGKYNPLEKGSAGSFAQVRFDRNSIELPKNAKLDFSGLRKGYELEQIHKILQDEGYKAYIIEIDGNYKAQGTNRDKPWRVQTEALSSGEAMIAIESSKNRQLKVIGPSGTIANALASASRKVSETEFVRMLSLSFPKYRYKIALNAN